MVTNDASSAARSSYWASRAAAGLEVLASRATGTVVVVPCRDGRALPMMEAVGARGVIGLDDDPVAVAHAREAHANDSVEVVEAELGDLPLVNDTYDTVVSWHGVSSGVDAGLVLAEVARITRPGGIVGIVVPNARALRRAGTGDASPDGSPASDAAFDAAGLETAMVAAGLAVTSMEGLAHDPAVAVRLTALGPDAVARLTEPAWDSDLVDAVGTASVEDFTPTRDLATSVDLIAWATPT